jgi:hypothetical protein
MLCRMANRQLVTERSMKYLRGMSGYPPASHAIAASIGWLLGSSLQAIFVTGALFTFGIYVILGLLMQRGAEKEFFGAAVALMALILAYCCLRYLFLRGFSRGIAMTRQMGGSR